MADSLLIADIAFYLRDDVPEGIDWWASAEPDHPISIVIEPSGPVDAATRVRVETVAAKTAKIVAEARAWLAGQLREVTWELTDDELTALANEPFDDPEIIVWSGDEWMIRFVSSSIAMAEEYGIGVLYEGDAPVAVEDLSEDDDEGHDH